MRCLWPLLLALPFAEVPAPPAIQPGGVVNAASLMPASLPGGALAPGARFRIPGVRLGPEVAAKGSESDPPTRLADVTVRLRQGNRSLEAGLFLVSGRRIEACLPADAPIGQLQLIINWQGRDSEPYPLTVVQSAVGLFTPETAPEPLAAQLRTLTAAPGGALTLFTTGLNSQPLRLFIGGRPAAAVRTVDDPCCRGVQRLQVTLAPATPLGCAVPVLASLPDGRATNTLPLPVAAPGQPCRDQVDWFRQTVEHARNAGFVVLARVLLDSGFALNHQFDYGIASFAHQETGQREFPPLPPFGACTTFLSRLKLREVLGQVRSPADWTSIPDRVPGSRRLDAGADLAVAAPSATRFLTRDRRRTEYYNAILGGSVPFSHLPPQPDFLQPGDLTLTAPGGAEVGPFAVHLKVPPVLLWKNRDAIYRIARSKGVTVEWKAARPNSAILILAANVDRPTGDSASCLCLAPARDGRFTIPPMGLANLPPTSNEDDISASYLLLVEMPADPPARIEARGLDAAFAAFISATAKAVHYQ